MAIAGLATAQHGVVAREQLVDLGIGPRAIDHRLEHGRLHRVHRGVFAVGHPVLSRHGAWMAAVLAAGRGAVLSHRSAAALWGIRDSAGAQVDVIVPRNRRARPRITIHRAVLPPDEVTVELAIPVTTPARTLLDLGGQLTPHRLERAVHEAEYRRLTSPLSLAALLTRHRGRRGTAALRRILDTQQPGQTITKSELEAQFLGFLDAHDIPRPLVNAAIGPYTVDALWPDHGLVVELDSRQAHATTRAFEQDRARDRHLLTRGYRVARITWRQLHDDGPEIATQLATLLSGTTRRAATR